MALTQPADRIEAFTVTCPALTTEQAAVTVKTPFAPAALVGLEIEIPDGHLGLTGLRLLIGGNQYIPNTPGQWIRGNDDSLEWAFNAYGVVDAWAAQLFNGDNYEHSWYLRYLLSDAIAAEAAVPSFLLPTPLIA